MRGSFVVKKSTPPRNTNTRNTEYRRESNDLPNTASDSRHIVHTGTWDTVNGPHTNNPRDNDGGRSLEPDAEVEVEVAVATGVETTGGRR